MFRFSKHIHVDTIRRFLLQNIYKKEIISLISSQDILDIQLTEIIQIDEFH